MTDEQLNQLLKDALTPDISDSDIQITRRKGKVFMKKKWGAIGIAAACAMLAVVVVAGISSKVATTTDDGSEIVSVTDTPVTEVASTTVEVQNEYYLSAYSTELVQGVIVPIVINNAQNWGLSGEFEDNHVSYVIGTDFQCKGDNIDFITYGINKGAFQIVELPDQSIVRDVVPFEGELNVGQNGGVEDESGNILTETTLATQFTVDYEQQSSDTTWINICNELFSEDIMNHLWHEDDTVPTLEEAGQWYAALVDGVEITCTVTFTDGTTTTSTIACSGKTMTLGEAGITEYCDGEDADTVSAFFVFELK